MSTDTQTLLIAGGVVVAVYLVYNVGQGVQQGVASTVSSPWSWLAGAGVLALFLL